MLPTCEPDRVVARLVAAMTGRTVELRVSSPWGPQRRPWWRDWFLYYALTVNAIVGGGALWVVQR